MADSDKNSNNGAGGSNPGDNNDTKQPVIQHMLMKLEMDRVCEKYKAMSSSPSSTITMRDVIMKIMIEEELRSIKMKYMGGLSRASGGQGAASVSNGEGMPSTSGEEMPSTSGEEDDAQKLHKCRRKLDF